LNITRLEFLKKFKKRKEKILILILTTTGTIEKKITIKEYDIS